MATMNVSLPDEMKAWVEEQAAGGRYANASDYVRDLVRRDQERKHLAELQAVVDRALASGVSARSREDLMEHARAVAAAALGERNGKENVA